METYLMSKKSNVHPDHYKTAGREPVGQGSVQELEKQAFGEAQSEERRDRKAVGKRSIAKTQKKRPKKN